MADILRLAWARYLRSLERKPLATKAITAGLLSGASDVVAQTLTASRPLNWRRTLAIAAFGFLWAGPSNHYWQKFLEKLFKGRRDGATVVQKVILDQCTYGPVCNILLISYLSLIVEGRSAQHTQLRLKRDYPGIQWNGWKLWPLAAFVNYTYVPLKLRVLFVNVVAFCWSTFLITRSKVPQAGRQLVNNIVK